MISPETLDAYAEQIDAAIATSSIDVNNDGQLIAPYNCDNWRTATFYLDQAPELNSVFRPYAPFRPSDPLSISLRHYFDPRGNDEFIYWVNGRDKAQELDANGHARNLTAVSVLHPQIDPRFYIQASNAVDINNEDFTGLSTSLLERHIDDISHIFEVMSIRDALTLAVLRLREQPLQQKLTKEVGIKSASNSAASNGFEVEAVRFNSESASKPHYSLASISLRQCFNAEAYDGVWQGLILKKVEVRQEPGKPTSATRSSKVTLMNNPYVGETGIGLYGDMRAEEPTPESLRHLLYPDRIPNSDDLDYFMALATQPLDFDELDIKI